MAAHRSAEQTLDLAGGWMLRAESTSAPGAVLPVGTIEAVVPGCVHLDLVRAGLVPALEVQGDGPLVDWIGRTAWAYTRQFDASPDLVGAERVELVFDGLQGLVCIELDGRELGRANNQFRTWRFDVNGLAAGSHTLVLHFADALAWLAAKEAERSLPAWGVGQDKDSSGAWLRASPVMFGWDFAPRAVTCGVWRGVRVEAWNAARLAGLQIRQVHEAGGVVLVRVAPTVVWAGADVATCSVAGSHDAVDARGSDGPLAIDGTNPKLVVRAELRLAGHRVATARGAVGDALELRVEKPQLWWPNGEGRATLYELVVELIDATGRATSRQARRIGLRRIQLVRERTHTGESEDESFSFRVNGRDLAVRGANWVPPQLHDAAEDARHVERLVELARRAHFNMLRVWGGGPYASEAFYDACDRAGLLVWQDLPFACCTYPTFDEDFLANVEAELREQCQRLHHRASLALLCGNNELENGLVEDEWTDKRMSWRDYSRLFDELAPRVVAAEAEGVAWWPGSPHSPLGDRMAFNDPRSGDAHLWDVWHGEAPFEHFLASRHRFASEFGFQSPPDPARLAVLLEPKQPGALPDPARLAALLEPKQPGALPDSARLADLLEPKQPGALPDSARLAALLEPKQPGALLGPARLDTERATGTVDTSANSSTTSSCDAGAPTMGSRQRSRDGEARIDRYLEREGLDPRGLAPAARDHLVRLVQARGMGLAMEHYRRAWPHCGGYLLWQFDEPWLAPSWSIVDAQGWCKPAFGAAARASAPQVLGLWFDPVSGHVRGAFTSHAPEEDARLAWSLEVRHLLAGARADPLDRRQGRVLAERGTVMLFEEELTAWVERLGVPACELLLDLTAVDQRRRMRFAQLVPAPLGRWRLAPPQLGIGRAHPIEDPDEHAFSVEVRVEHHAPFPIARHTHLAVACEPALRILSPDRTAQLVVRVDRPVRAAELLNGLSIDTLWDLTRNERDLGDALP